MPKPPTSSRIDPACCSDRVESLDTPLDPSWLPWILEQASTRAIATVCVRETVDGWVEIEATIGIAETKGVPWYVSQRQGCRGISTRLLVDGEQGRVAIFHDRAPGRPESATWRALLLEALVLCNALPLHAAGTPHHLVGA